MTVNRGLLGQIEADLLAGKPLADLLRKTMLLGQRAGSPELRDWATQELKGYNGDVREVPPFRTINAPMLLDGQSGFNLIRGQHIPLRELPDFVQESLGDGVPLRMGVGELEAWLQRGETVRMSVPGGDVLAEMYKNEEEMQQVHSIYWSISPALIASVLDQVRTALTELIGELVGVVPQDSIPTSEQATQAVNIAVHGHRAQITVTAAQATGDASVAKIESATPQPVESGWWTRARKIAAVIVGIATIVGAVAAVLVLF